MLLFDQHKNNTQINKNTKPLYPILSTMNFLLNFTVSGGKMGRTCTACAHAEK